MTKGRDKANTWSIAYTWFISYLGVFSIPLLVFAFVSFRFVQISDDVIKKYNTLSGQQVQVFMDSVLSEVHSIVDDIGNAPEIKTIVKASSRSSLSTLQLFAAQEKVSKTRVMRNDIDEFFLYCPSFDLTIAGTSYTSSKDFYDSYLNGTTFTREDWNDIISSKYPTSTVFDFSSLIPGAKIDKLLIVTPLNLFLHGDQYMNVAVVLNRAEMHLSNSSFDAFENLVIVDKIRQRVLYNNTGYLLSSDDLNFRWLGTGNQSFEQTIQGKRFIVSCVDSKIQNWKFLTLEPKEQNLGVVLLIRRTFLICLILCFLLGIAFVIYLTRRAYKGIDNVIRTIDSPNTVKGNELQYISHAITSLQDEKKEINTRFTQQKALLQDQIICSLLEKYPSDNKANRHELAQYGIEFVSNYFMVFIYEIKGNPAMFDDLLRKSYSLSLEGTGFVSYPFHSEKVSGALLNLPDGKIETLQASLRLWGERFRSLLPENISIACSNVCCTYLDLSGCYSQALDVLEYSRQLEFKNFMFYQDMLDFAKGRSFDYPIDLEVQIMEDLKKGDEDSVLSSIDTIIKRNLEREVPPKQMRFLMLNIAGTIIKVFSRLDEKLFVNYPEISLHPILQSSTVENIKSEIAAVVHSICQVLRRSIDDESGQQDLSLYNVIISYIQKNYLDKMMSVALIADDRGLSLPTLSRLFNKYNGELISDYIVRCRLTQAKKLLHENLSLEVVADQCGFGSLRTFMRVFKNSEQMTPGQYEAMYGKE
ncbi:MAG: AraC family transcriptional regulator [Sphaerochaetaceae bacterium]